jgi:hypothetical protein
LIHYLFSFGKNEKLNPGIFKVEEGNQKQVKIQTIFCVCLGFFSRGGATDQKISDNCKEKIVLRVVMQLKIIKIWSHLQKKGKNEPFGRSYPHRG